MKIDNFQDKQLILGSVFNLYILKYQLYTNASKKWGEYKICCKLRLFSTESRAEKERMVIEFNISSTRQECMKKVSGNKRIRRKV